MMTLNRFGDAEASRGSPEGSADGTRCKILARQSVSNAFFFVGGENCGDSDPDLHSIGVATVQLRLDCAVEFAMAEA